MESEECEVQSEGCWLRKMVPPFRSFVVTCFCCISHQERVSTPFIFAYKFLEVKFRPLEIMAHRLFRQYRVGLVKADPETNSCCDVQQRHVIGKISTVGSIIYRLYPLNECPKSERYPDHWAIYEVCPLALALTNITTTRRPYFKVKYIS